MVDTVRLLIGAEPTEDQLKQFWIASLTQRPGAEPSYKYYYNPPDELGTLPRFTFRPKSHAGTRQISVEVSLPKLVFGNNHELLTDVGPALDRLDDIIAADPALPPMPPMADAPLSRLDLCCNYHVGDLLPHYINALAALTYPRRDTLRFNAETVEFRAASIKSKFYDKHAETQGQAPPGTLRHEITYHRARPIKQAFATNTPVLPTHIIPDIVEAILAQDLARLGILDKPFPTADTAAPVLRVSFGTIRGPRLYGLLRIYQDLGTDATARLLGITRNALNRSLADIRSAGIATAITDAHQDLPPLRVSLPRTSSPPQTCTQTPGVTPGSLGSPTPAQEVAGDDDH